MDRRPAAGNEPTVCFSRGDGVRLDVGRGRRVPRRASVSDHSKCCAPFERSATMVCLSGSWQARVTDDADAVGHRSAASAPARDGSGREAPHPPVRRARAPQAVESRFSDAPDYAADPAAHAVDLRFISLIRTRRIRLPSVALHGAELGHTSCSASRTIQERHHDANSSGSSVLIGTCPIS